MASAHVHGVVVGADAGHRDEEVASSDGKPERDGVLAVREGTVSRPGDDEARVGHDGTANDAVKAGLAWKVPRGGKEDGDDGVVVGRGAARGLASEQRGVAQLQSQLYRVGQGDEDEG
jgi:hypothetical protein